VAGTHCRVLSGQLLRNRQVRSPLSRNIHNCNFHRSTPHFYGQKNRLNELTSCVKDYPEAPPSKQKGLTDLGRMTGREQIKGSIRRNMENPH
jgi:hypothetical protein